MLLTLLSVGNSALNGGLGVVECTAGSAREDVPLGGGRSGDALKLRLDDREL